MGDIAGAAMGPIGLMSGAGGGGALGGIAGSVGGTLGGVTNGLYNGLGLNNTYGAVAPELMQPVTEQQARDAYARAQAALDQQNAFLQALQAQGTQGMGSQTALGQMLMDQAQGKGANPAQAMLSNATGANVANQAALMAGQRGASANPGLIARQAAMQGGALQQQAAGQSALMQAQQQLAAQNQLQNLAATQIGQQAGVQNQYNIAAQNEQQNLLNAIAAQNQNRVTAQGNINQVNASVNAGNQAARGQLIGNITGAAGSAMGLAHGGQVPQKAGPRSYVAKFAMGGHVVGEQLAAKGEMVPGKAVVQGDSPKNDIVDAKLSPGEIVIPRSIAQSPDAIQKSAEFVAAVLRKKGRLK